MSLFARYTDNRVGFNLKGFVGGVLKGKDGETNQHVYTKDLITTDKKYLEKVLVAWRNSPERQIMIDGERYYVGQHDVLDRVRMAIGESGELEPITNVVNNKLVDNQYKKLVDQKTNYVLGKPMTISTEKEEYLDALNKIFNKNIHRKLKVLAQYSIDGGIAWLYPYFDEEGKFDVMIFPSYEICPVWKDKSHTKLVCAIRYYKEEVFTENGGVTVIEHADVFTADGVDHYLVNGNSFKEAKIKHSSYIYSEDGAYNWGRLPIIPFKYNTNEIPLIVNVKSLQDALNETLSDFQNNMQEDFRQTILILQNYDGVDLAEFRHNLMTFGAVKVTTIDGVKGGLDALKVEVNSSNYQALLMQLKRAIIENGRGFDAKEERMDGDPNQMNIESMYTDIDLDVNGMESEFQASFEELRWFINKAVFKETNVDYSDELVEFVFNRDIFINEDAKISSCVNSVGIISNKTIISRHPWVDDVKRELNQIEEERQQELKQMEELNNSFGDPNSNVKNTLYGD